MIEDFIGKQVHTECAFYKQYGGFTVDGEFIGYCPDFIYIKDKDDGKVTAVNQKFIGYIKEGLRESKKET